MKPANRDESADTHDVLFHGSVRGNVMAISIHTPLELAKLKFWDETAKGYTRL